MLFGCIIVYNVSIIIHGYGRINRFSYYTTTYDNKTHFTEQENVRVGTIENGFTYYYRTGSLIINNVIDSRTHINQCTFFTITKRKLDRIKSLTDETTSVWRI